MPPNARRGAGRAGAARDTRGAARGLGGDARRGAGRAGAARDTRGAARGLGGEQVEGRQAVRELLAAGARRVTEVWICDDLEPSDQLDQIERLAIRRKIKLVPASRRQVDAAARTDAHQGVIARAAPLEEASLEELCEPTGKATPLLLVLDGITDPHNLGALMRSALCAGVTGVVLPRHRAVHVTPTVAKAAAGAIEHLPMTLVAGIPSALQRMAGLGVTAVGLDPGSDVSIDALGAEATEPLALVLGSEGRGIAPLAAKRCAKTVAIPMYGAIGSLNVAAAGAVACFTVARLRQASSQPGD